MKESEIRSYAALMKELGLTGLELTDGDKVVRMERAVQVQTAPAISNVQESRGGESKTATDQKPGQVNVTSDIIGVFYAAPSSSAAPFVKVGDHVKKGQTLCIVEAMKLMNEVEAPCDGEITAAYVPDGQTVEYGTKLFSIQEA